MIALSLRSLFCFSVLFVGTAAVIAQPAEPSRPKPSAFTGETIALEGKVSRLGISVTVADFSLKASAMPDGRTLSIKSEALSKGTLLKLFRYSFEQNYESIVDLTNFRITKTTKRDVQKQRVRDSEAIFNYTDRRVVWVETDPKDPNRPPKRIASELGTEMHDMVSGIYALRLMPLVVGKRYELFVSDSGLVYRVPVAVTGREQLTTSIGRVWCLRVEPEIFGNGRLIEQKGKMILWLTDDDRRIPVRAKIDSQYGRLEMKISAYFRPLAM